MKNDTDISALIEFIEARQPIQKPLTKFGGQPVWVEGDAWPKSKETGNPMRFIAQITLDERVFPNGSSKIAYIFMTDEDTYVDGTWDPSSGENAVVIQTMSNDGLIIGNGPTLDNEYSVELSLAKDEVEYEDDELMPREGNKIGGMALFIQADETPTPGQWRLLLQLDSAQTPFEINFGDSGVGYIFINQDYSQGQLLWQCF